MILTLFGYVTLTLHDFETASKQLAGHMLVKNDTLGLYLIVHHLVPMLCTHLECLCWMAAMLDLCENRAFSMKGFRVTWGKAPPFGDDLSLTYLFASTSEKSYMYVTNYMLCV